MAGGFWGGFSGSFAQGIQLGRSLGAQRDINKLDDEEVTKEFKQTGLKENPIQTQNRALSDQLLGDNAPVRGEFSNAAPETRGIPESFTANTGSYTPESYARQLRAEDMREAMNAEITQENFREQARADLNRAMSAEQFAYDQANPPEGLVNPKARPLRASMTPTYGPGAIPYEERELIPEGGPTNVEPTRGLMSRNASFDPDGYSYLGKSFDAPLTEYDRQYAKQDAIADIYAKRGLHDLSEKARSRAMDFREKGQDRAFREDERAYSRGRDAVSDEQAAIDRAERVRARQIAEAQWQYEQDQRDAQRGFDNRIAADEIELRGRQVADTERNSAVSRKVAINRDFRDAQQNTMAVFKHNMEYYDWFQKQDEARKLAEVDNAFFNALEDPRGFDRLFDLAAPTFNNAPPNGADDNDGMVTRDDNGVPIAIGPDGRMRDITKWLNSQDPLTRRVYAGVLHQYARAAVTGKYDEATAAWASLQTGLSARGKNDKTQEHLLSYQAKLNSDLERFLAMKDNADSDDAIKEADRLIRITTQEIENVRSLTSGNLNVPAPPIPVGTPIKEGGQWFLMGDNGQKIPATYDARQAKVIPTNTTQGSDTGLARGDVRKHLPNNGHDMSYEQIIRNAPKWEAQGFDIQPLIDQFIASGSTTVPQRRELEGLTR